MSRYIVNTSFNPRSAFCVTKTENQSTSPAGGQLAAGVDGEAGLMGSVQSTAHPGIEIMRGAAVAKAASAAKVAKTAAVVKAAKDVADLAGVAGDGRSAATFVPRSCWSSPTSRCTATRSCRR
jgi:hypothetical protein